MLYPIELEVLICVRTYRENPNGRLANDKHIRIRRCWEGGTKSGCSPPKPPIPRGRKHKVRDPPPGLTYRRGLPDDKALGNKPYVNCLRRCQA
jgi:hypothetical protein